MRFVAFLLSMMLASGIARAFDCVGVTFPPTVVLCSDPELKRLADERQEAINEARGRIGEQAWPALWEDQKRWVRSYATACGVPPDQPPPIPVPASVKECFRQAGVARIAYLRAYNSPGGAPPEPPTTAAGNLPNTVLEQAQPRYAACADVDWGCLSMRMREAMTEQEVINAMGYRPNKVEMNTRGSSTSNPWSCKKYTFGGLYNNITVYFQQSDTGSWIVNSWSVFP